MIAIIAKLASMKKTIAVVVIGFFVGVSFGVWGTNKFYTIGKIAMLDRYIESQNISHELTVKNLSVLHGKQIKIAIARGRADEVKKSVNDNRDCDISSDTERLLDGAGTSMSVATSRANARVSGLTAITQRQQVTTCYYDRLDYIELKAVFDGLKSHITDNWKPP